MSKNEMSKGGIQKLRDLIVEELKMNEFPVVSSDANLVENVITLLHRSGKIQWVESRPPRVLVLSQIELRSLADQCQAYDILLSAGAHVPLVAPLMHVHGRPVAYLLPTPEKMFVEIKDDEEDLDELDWITYEERRERFKIMDRDDFE